MKVIQFALLTAAAGLIVGCSSPSGAYSKSDAAPLSYGPERQVDVELMSIPAQNTVRREMESEPIAKIEREIRYGQTVYFVEFERPNWHTSSTTLVVNADGALLADSRDGHIEVAMGGEAPPGLGQTFETDPTRSNPAASVTSLAPSSAR